ncbi:hypothetical protein PMAYCL1PPCAC_27333, partial [Pristionchus mayeri]
EAAQKRAYKCEQCGNAYRTPGHLKRHQLAHSDLERCFKCADCGMSFKEEYALKKHMHVHNGTHPHKCDLCGTGCNTAHALQIHKEKFC